MALDDADVESIVGRSMVARIATVSRNGRPSVNPLYFVQVNGKIWLGTADWTLAARNISSGPHVSLLFEVERDSSDQRVVRMHGRARLLTDRRAQRAYALRVARKYVLTPSGIHNIVTHARQLKLRRRYYAQSSEKGRPCVIEVTAHGADILTG